MDNMKDVGIFIDFTVAIISIFYAFFCKGPSLPKMPRFLHFILMLCYAPAMFSIWFWQEFVHQDPIVNSDK